MLPPKNRKSRGFLMFSGGRERVHELKNALGWDQVKHYSYAELLFNKWGLVAYKDLKVIAQRFTIL